MALIVITASGGTFDPSDQPLWREWCQQQLGPVHWVDVRPWEIRCYLANLTDPADRNQLRPVASRHKHPSPAGSQPAVTPGRASDRAPCDRSVYPRGRDRERGDAGRERSDRPAAVSGGVRPEGASKGSAATELTPPTVEATPVDQVTPWSHLD